MSNIISPPDKKNEAHRLAAMIRPKDKDSFMGTAINEHKLYHTYPGTRSAIVSRDMYDMCPCCLEVFPAVKPIKLLCCRHAVCEHCISSIKEARCPLCREVFPLHAYTLFSSSRFEYQHAQLKLQLLLNNPSSQQTANDVFIYLCGEGYTLLSHPGFRFTVLKKLAELYTEWEHSYKFYVILFSHADDPPPKIVQEDKLWEESPQPPPLRRSLRLRNQRTT